MGLAVAHTNLLGEEGSTITSSKLHPNSTLADIHDPILGKRVRMNSTFYIHDTTANGVVKNDLVEFDEGAGDLTATLTTGTYSGDELATELGTQLTAAGADTYTVTHDDALPLVGNAFKIENDTHAYTMHWTSGVAATVQFAADTGFGPAADQASTGGPDFRVEAANNSKSMGNFVKLALDSGSGIDFFAIYKVRFALIKGATLTPGQEPEDFRIALYSAASDLGDDPRRWVAGGSHETTTSGGDDGEVMWTSAANIPDVNQLQVHVFPATTTSLTWHYFHFADGSAGGADFNFPFLETGLFFVANTAGYATIGSALPCPTTADANRVIENVEPGRTQTAQSSFEYSARGPQFYNINSAFNLNSEAAWQDEIEPVRRILGNSRSGIYIPDDTRADLQDSFSAFIAKWQNPANYRLKGADFADININLRSQVD